MRNLSRRHPMAHHQSATSIVRRTFLGLIAAALTLPGFAAPESAARTLVHKDAKKTEIRHSMMGFRNTVIFYAFADQQTILVLNVDNKTDKFPVTGTVYLFDASTTEEGLGKWINNQHSDGLFPEVPKPTLTSKLPDEACRVIERKVVEKKKADRSGQTFQDVLIKLSVKDHKVEGKFQLKAFKDDAHVFLKETNG